MVEFGEWANVYRGGGAQAPGNQVEGSNGAAAAGYDVYAAKFMHLWTVAF